MRVEQLTHDERAEYGMAVMKACALAQKYGEPMDVKALYLILRRITPYFEIGDGR